MPGPTAPSAAPRKLRGVVDRIVFHNKESSYYVLRMDIEGQGGKPQVVVGNIVGIDVVAGVRFSFLAKTGHHEKYGPQWIILEAPLSITEWGDEEILSLVRAYAQGGFLHSQLRKLKEQGHSVSQIVSDRGAFEALLGEEGAIVQDSWDSFVAVMEGHRYLHSLGLSPQDIQIIWEKLGHQAKSILAQDPWLLSDFGIPFSTVDGIAEMLRHPKTAPRRILACMLNVLKEGQREGDLYGSALEVIAKTKMVIPDLHNEALKEAFQLAKLSKSVVKGNDECGQQVLYTRSAFHVEDNSAELLVRRTLSAVQTRYLPEEGEEEDAFEQRMVSWVDAWMEPLQIRLTLDQKKAVYAALVKPVSVLTGLPGTGKTTTLRILVKIFQDQGIRFALMAPTGIAAKRMAAVTGADATTIHRAFQARAVGRERQSSYAGIEDEDREDGRSREDVGFGWTMMEGVEVVVVDECSMLDQYVLHKILTCTEETTRLVFVGDAAQLPSVGPGRVLHEMIDSGLFRTTDLRDIFRQETTSDIVVAAHAIHAGRVPETGKDFQFVEKRRDEDVRDFVLAEAQRLLGVGETFQVLSPRHRGVVGVTDLNRELRRLLNPSLPGAQELRIQQEVLRLGDRIMVCKNDYTHDIYNGDIGKIHEILFGQGSECKVEVKIFGPPPVVVTLEKDEATKLLRLAYAMTVHKSQGQEYDHIILPWTMSMGKQLQRTLLYTAVTRAKKRVVVVGHWGAVAQAVATTDQIRRRTLFGRRIREYADRVMDAHG